MSRTGSPAVPRPTSLDRTVRLAAAPAAAAVAASLALASPAAWAQRYPERSVQIVVPYAPGGSVDVIARALAQKLTEQTGQTFFIDNRAGAGGTIGVGAVARAKPDGYTLVLTSLGALTVTVHLTKAGYDPLKDLAPISLIATSGLVISVKNDSPIRSMRDLIDAAKAKPGSINYSVTGVGSQTFLAGELLKRSQGLDMTSVQYKGGGPAAAAVAAGEVHAGITDSGPIQPLLQSNRVRVLAVTGGQRASAMPDVPTMEEAGVPGFRIDSAMALLAPAGTPPEIVRKLNAEVATALKSPDLVERIHTASHDPKPNTPEQMRDMLKEEFDRWGALVREVGVKLE
ncbi:Tripartite tricarboxylate transporter family receptor [Pigmentiphaga humi]|uniref:Tripartite tricarboxylate transporter family receptor n=1 Tax=Pigmentiphaga humi TaxID=2478468 RepID=A0A3P4B050_9BURK|nr:tripartite tricarboxylate transporter substrate binding protein [Pigmentiphaga humi]VCU69211.1 Tripartite tricarboxylate transporter family receptor [Pigmentiphaga humi]